MAMIGINRKPENEMHAILKRMFINLTMYKDRLKIINCFLTKGNNFAEDKLNRV